MRTGQICPTALIIIASLVSAGGAAIYFADDDPLRSAEPTIVQPNRWTSRWDPEVGLWWQDHHGHTEQVMDLARVHSAPGATSRLLLAAQAEALDQVDVSAVLSAIRKMQVLDGGRDHGCLKWYWEEDELADKNASFFAGLSLIAIQRGYADQLSNTQQAQLADILKDLHTAFATRIKAREFFYPNRSLGELVCAYLIAEMYAIDAERDELLAGMHDGADYFQEHAWGWGEHLSDIYSGICLDQLSALLLFSKSLPDDLREKYTRLFHYLLEIDDAFGSRPRVPAMRSYAFGVSPTRVSYRDWVTPLESGALVTAPVTPVMPPEEGGVFQQRPPLGATLHAFGWDKLAGDPAVARRDISLPCFDGAVARAHLEDDIVIGSVTKFPLMPTAEHFEWGMAWQCFPVAFHRTAGDWGFFQWESRHGERVRAHPANDWMTSYHENALVRSFSPPPVGETYTLQHGGNLLILRVLNVVPTDSDSMHDRLRIVDPTVHGTVIESADYWRQLVLKYPERTIAVQCLPFTQGASLTLMRTTNDRGRHIMDWGLKFDRDAMASSRSLMTVWAISSDGEIEHAPVIEGRKPEDGAPRTDEEKIKRLRWKWPNVEWNVEIDALSETPLRDLNDARPPRQPPSGRPMTQ